MTSPDPAAIGSVGARVGVPKPLGTVDGRWSTGGWSRPGFLADRRDPWAVGDHVAFGEQEPVAAHEFVHQALAGCDPTRHSAQVAQGDLTGNALRVA